VTLRETYKKQGAFLFRWRSYLPLLIGPLLLLVFFDSQYTQRLLGDNFYNYWEGFCIFVSFSGLFVRSLVAGYVPAGTSGRNTQAQAASALNMTGLYSIVRNPLYLGNYLIILGLLLFIKVWWFVLVGTAIFWIFYERIIFTEEEFLHQKFGDAYTEWTAKTPFFIPRFKNWKKPILPFSWKTVLRREHSTLFGTVSTLTLLGISADLFVERSGTIDIFWGIFWGASLIIYLVLRFLKKKTHLLDIQGR